VDDLHCEVSPTEKILTAIWARELGTTEIAANDDFFQLGGDSLRMLMMLFQVKAAFGVEISPGVLFQDSTLRGFSRAIDIALGDPNAISDTVFIEGQI
jgi:acyl carrier protein